MNDKFLLFFFVCAISLFHCVPRVLGTPIIGGYIDEDHSFKYHVSLHKIVNLRTYEYICSGSIIHEKFILTAAHCFMIVEDGKTVEIMNLAEERPKIIAGTNKLDGSGIEKAIDTIFIPNTYQDSPIIRADIAVVQLEDNLDVASQGRTWDIISIGVLPPFEENKKAIFSGYGAYELDQGKYVNDVSEVNRYLPVKLLHQSICNAFFICAVPSDTSEPRASCKGDSGAGLVYNNKIVGVLSHGPKDCLPNGMPEVFIRLSPLKKQIDRAMNELTSHSDMHVLRDDSTPHQSPIHQAGPSSPHNEASPVRRKKKILHLPKIFGKKPSKS